MQEKVMLGGKPVQGFVLGALGDNTVVEKCSCAGAFWGGAFFGAAALFVGERLFEYAQQRSLFQR